MSTVSDKDEIDYSKYSNEELLKLGAQLDEDRYPIASRCQNALDQLEESE